MGWVNDNLMEVLQPKQWATQPIVFIIVAERGGWLFGRSSMHYLG